MVPMMIQNGYRALAVTFDVWGIANMVKDGMTKARALAQSLNDPPKEEKEVTLNAKE
jgi:4-hydroxy-2-oxoheptanedioate aldolase